MLGDTDNEMKLMSLKIVMTLFVGLLGSILIWVLTSFNNLVVGTSYVADSYLPIGALFLIVFLSACVNPFLRKVHGHLAFNRLQLGIIAGMLLVASVPPGQGLYRMLPHAISRVPIAVRESPRLAEVFDEMDLPPSLFPDPVGFGEETPAGEQFLTELSAGERIPWNAWVGPLVSWGTFILFCWSMMVGMAMIVYPQWRENERLAFPLLTVEKSLIENGDESGFLPLLFRQKSFWLAAGVVFCLHLLVGGKLYSPESVPAIPLRWNMRALFSEAPLVYLPGYICQSQIYFVFLGIAFFMPSRISFSVWFTVIAYALYMLVGKAYCPPFYVGTITEHRTGAMVALTIGIVWLGRKHWARVLKSVVKKPRANQDNSDRKAALLFLGGSVGMAEWLIWAGVQPLWTIVFVGFGFMVSLLITRIVAETGMPFIRIDVAGQFFLVRMLPPAMLSPVTVYFSYVMAMLFPIASRVNATTMASHALGLNEKLDAKKQTGFAYDYRRYVLRCFYRSFGNSKHPG